MSAAAATEPKRPLKEDLRALFRAPRELWIVLFAKFLESIGLFSLLYTVVLWLSHDYGFSDVKAGWWVGTFSMCLSLLAFVTGFVADSIGFRTALMIAFGSSTLARGVMSFSNSSAMAITGLMLLTVGAAAGVPVMNVALRRYTNNKNRSFAFSIYYLSFNIGGAVAGWLVDRCRNAFKDPTTSAQIFRQIKLPIVGETRMSAYSMVYLIGFGCAFLAFLVSCCLRKNPHVEDEEPPEVHAPGAKRRDPLSIAVDVMKEKAFWRFLLFMGLLALVKLIFQHYHFTFPKYAIRELGESFPLGTYQSINPIIIIFLVPLATIFTRHRSAFNCIVLGSIVSTVSMFALCFPPYFQFALFGGTWSLTILISIVILSLGEALWSPRVYEYSAIIAPRGKEASYMGLSALPYFFAKMIAGPMSGYLLARYCAETGPRQSWVMWAIIGGMTAMGPILILSFRGVIEKKDPPTVTP
ncbi:MAG: MFS transporter, partial [Polyangiales bacterium]